MVKMMSTPNPDSMKFVPEGERVLPPELGTGSNYDARAVAGGPGTAPRIVKRLFRIQGVRNVFLGPDFLTVNKHEDLDWDTLQPLVLNAVMDACVLAIRICISCVGRPFGMRVTRMRRVPPSAGTRSGGTSWRRPRRPPRREARRRRAAVPRRRGRWLRAPMMTS